MLPSADHAARAFAEAFARLIRLAPRAGRGAQARPGAVMGGLEPRRGRTVALSRGP
jgi:cation transport regulator ChaC